VVLTLSALAEGRRDHPLRRMMEKEKVRKDDDVLLMELESSVEPANKEQRAAMEKAEDSKISLLEEKLSQMMGSSSSSSKDLPNAPVYDPTTTPRAREDQIASLKDRIADIGASDVKTGDDAQDKQLSAITDRLSKLDTTIDALKTAVQTQADLAKSLQNTAPTMPEDFESRVQALLDYAKDEAAKIYAMTCPPPPPPAPAPVAPPPPPPAETVEAEVRDVPDDQNSDTEMKPAKIVTPEEHQQVEVFDKPDTSASPAAATPSAAGSNTPAKWENEKTLEDTLPSIAEIKNL